MSKSIEDWREHWNKTYSEEEHYGADAGKSLALLSNYSSFYKTSMGAIGGTLGRLFSGRWNSHHGNAIQDGISKYYVQGSNTYYWDQKYHSIKVILAFIKQGIGENQINKNGDLFKILQVIKEKTNVDYFELNATQIIDEANENFINKRNFFTD